MTSTRSRLSLAIAKDAETNGSDNGQRLRPMSNRGQHQNTQSSFLGVDNTKQSQTSGTKRARQKAFRNIHKLTSVDTQQKGVSTYSKPRSTANKFAQQFSGLETLGTSPLKQVLKRSTSKYRYAATPDAASQASTTPTSIIGQASCSGQTVASPMSVGSNRARTPSKRQRGTELFRPPSFVGESARTNMGDTRIKKGDNMSPLAVTGNKKLIEAVENLSKVESLVKETNVKRVAAFTSQSKIQEIRSGADFTTVEQLERWLYTAGGISTSRWGLHESKTLNDLWREMKANKSVIIQEEGSRQLVRVVRVARVVIAQQDANYASPTRPKHAKIHVNVGGLNSTTAMPATVEIPVVNEATRANVHVVRPRPKRFLLESHQEIKSTSGRVRSRERKMLLSVLLQNEESVAQGVRRAVVKELGNIDVDTLPSKMAMQEGVWGAKITGDKIENNRGRMTTRVEQVPSQSFPTLPTRYILHTMETTLNEWLPESSFSTIELDELGAERCRHYWNWVTSEHLDSVLSTNRSYNRVVTGSDFSRIHGTLAGDQHHTIGSFQVLHDLCKHDFNVIEDSIAVADVKAALSRWDYSALEIERIVNLIPDSDIGRAKIEDESEEEEEDDSDAEYEEDHRSIDYAAGEGRDDLSRQTKRTNTIGGFQLDASTRNIAMQPIISLQTFRDNVAPEVLKRMITFDDEHTRAINDHQRQVLFNLFPHSCRIRLKLLHGGFGGALVLQVRSHAPGQREDPTVVKIDKREVMNQEQINFVLIADHMGAWAPDILEADVQSQEFDSNPNPLGGLKFQLAGAAWFLPDLIDDADMLSTFKQLYEAKVAHEIVAESHPASSPSHRQKPSKQRQQLVANVKSVFGESPEQVLKEVFGEIMRTASLETKTRVPMNLFKYYSIEKYIKREILRDGTYTPKGEQISLSQMDADKSLRRSMHLVMEAIFFWKGKTTGEYFEALVHGDLNGQNILLDSENVVWMIDYAMAGRGHLLRDLAKLESCILIEYTPLATENDLNMAMRMVDSLAMVPDLRRKLHPHNFTVSELSPALRYAWTTISIIRMYVSNYCRMDPDPLQLCFAMLSLSLKALHFVDITDNQKHLAVYMCKSYAARLSDAHRDLLALSSTQPHITGPVSQLKAEISTHLDAGDRVEIMNMNLSEHEYAYELHRYFHALLVNESYVVDVITRSKVNIMEQCINLEFVEGSSRDEVIQRKDEMDEIQDKMRHQRRWKALRGVVRNVLAHAVIETTAKKNKASTDLLDIVEIDHLVILGGAASGKSCLLRKILVTAAQNQALGGGSGASGCSNSFGGSGIVNNNSVSEIVNNGMSVDGTPLQIQCKLLTPLPENQMIVPVLILLIDLGRMMFKNNLNSKHDLLDEHLKNVNGEHSGRLAFFRRARAKGKLAVLLDGLDEAGEHKEEVEMYIQRLCKEEKMRVVVSSRTTGFNDQVFADFRFVQVLPLTEAMQGEIIKARLRNRDLHAGSLHKLRPIREELRKHQYSEIVRNPLMLTLLVSLLAASNAGSEAYTRMDLYERAVAQLLHKSSMIKFGMRRGQGENFVEESAKVLASTLCYDFLKTIAFTSHVRRLRDIFPSDLTDVMEIHRNDAVYKESITNESGYHFMVNTLRRAVFEGFCGLFAVSKVVMTAAGQERVNHVMRFVHLSFQEYLCGLFLLDHINAAFKEKQTSGRMSPSGAFTSHVVKLLSKDVEKRDMALLHDPWWQNTLLGMAAGMDEDLFNAFVDILTSHDDASGANVMLASQMLAEIPNRSFIRSTKAEVENKIKAAFAKYRKNQDLARALAHPSHHLQHLALCEIGKFVDAREIVTDMLFDGQHRPNSLNINETRRPSAVRTALNSVYGATGARNRVWAPSRRSRDENSSTANEYALTFEPWYVRAAALKSLGLLQEVAGDDSIVRALIHYWGDECEVVRTKAVEATRAVVVEGNHPEIVREIIMQLNDEVENPNAHVLIVVLHVIQPSIIHKLMSHTISTTELSLRAVETLELLAADGRVREILCTIVGTSDNAGLKQNAAEIFISASHAIETQAALKATGGGRNERRHSSHARASFSSTSSAMSTSTSASNAQALGDIELWINMCRALGEWIKHPDLEMAVMGCETVARLRVREESVVSALESVTANSSLPSLLIASAMEALYSIDTELHASFVQDLIDCLQRPGAKVRCVAVRLAAKVLLNRQVQSASERDVSMLTSRMLNTLNDPEASVRKAAVEAIQHLSFKNLSLVTPFLSNKSVSVRRLSVSIIAHATETKGTGGGTDPSTIRNSETVLKSLLEIAHTDPAPELRTQALVAAFRMSEELEQFNAVVGVVKLLLMHSEYEFKDTALTLLREMDIIETQFDVIDMVVDVLSEEEQKAALVEVYPGSKWAFRTFSTNTINTVTKMARHGFKISNERVLHMITSQIESVRQIGITLCHTNQYDTDISIREAICRIIKCDGSLCVRRATAVWIRRNLGSATRDPDLAVQKAFEYWLCSRDEAALLAAIDEVSHPLVNMDKVATLLFNVLDKTGAGEMSRRSGCRRESKSTNSGGNDAGLATRVRRAVLYCVEKLNFLLSVDEFLDALRLRGNDHNEGTKSSTSRAIIACEMVIRTGLRDCNGDDTERVAKRCFEIVIESTQLKDLTDKVGDEESHRNETVTGPDSSSKIALSVDVEARHILATEVEKVLMAKFRHSLAPVSHYFALLKDGQNTVRRLVLQCLQHKLTIEVIVTLGKVVLRTLSIGLQNELLVFLRQCHAPPIGSEIEKKLELLVLSWTAEYQSGPVSLFVSQVLTILPQLTRESFAAVLLRVDKSDNDANRKLALASFKHFRSEQFEFRPSITDLLAVKPSKFEESMLAWIHFSKLVLGSRPGRVEIDIKHQCHGDVNIYNNIIDRFSNLLESEYKAVILAVIDAIQRLKLNRVSNKAWAKVLDSWDIQIVRAVTKSVEANLVVLDADLVQIFVQIMGQEDDMLVSREILSMFRNYVVPDASNALNMLKCLGDEITAPFAFDPLLHFFRERRAQRPNTDGGGPLSGEMHKALESLVKGGVLEATYLSRELRVELDVKSSGPSSNEYESRFSLQGRAYVLARKRERMEQKLMHEEEWRMARAKWTANNASVAAAPSRVNNVLVRLPSYQRSNIQQRHVHVYIIADPSGMHAELDALNRVVFPQVNKWLNTLGIRVRVSGIDPRRFPQTERKATATTNGTLSLSKSQDAKRLEYIHHDMKESSPFVIALMGDRYGTLLRRKGKKNKIKNKDKRGERSGLEEAEIESEVSSDDDDGYEVDSDIERESMYRLGGSTKSGKVSFIESEDKLRIEEEENWHRCVAKARKQRMSYCALERYNSFMQHTYEPAKALVYLRSPSFGRNILTSEYRRPFLWEHSDMNKELRVQYLNEIEKMKQHKYTTVRSYAVDCNMETMRHESKPYVEDLEGFEAMATRDLFSIIMSEFDNPDTTKNQPTSNTLPGGNTNSNGRALIVRSIMCNSPKNGLSTLAPSPRANPARSFGFGHREKRSLRNIQDAKIDGGNGRGGHGSIGVEGGDEFVTPQEQNSIESAQYFLIEERTIHEAALVSLSNFSKVELRFPDGTPRCRRECYNMLLEHIEDDMRRDSGLKRDRQIFRNNPNKFQGTGNQVSVVTGSMGCGKSAFLATFADMYRNKMPSQTRVVFHACSFSPASTADFSTVLLRLGCEIIEQLMPHLNEDDCVKLNLPTRLGMVNAEWVDNWWSKVLEVVSKAAVETKWRPILIVDALDVVHTLGTEEAEHVDVLQTCWTRLTWSRKQGRMPPGISMIISVSDGDAANSLLSVISKGLDTVDVDDDEEMRHVVLSSLEEREKGDVIHRLLSENMLRLNAEQMNKLLRKPGASSPLFLYTACREVYMQGLTDSSTVGQWLDTLPADEWKPGTGNRTVFDETLLRAENNFGSEVVQRALCIVAVAGSILEIDLVDLLSQTANISHGSWSRLSFALEPFLWIGNIGRASTCVHKGSSNQDSFNVKDRPHRNSDPLMQLPIARQLSLHRSLTLDTDTSAYTAASVGLTSQVGGPSRGGEMTGGASNKALENATRTFVKFRNAAYARIVLDRYFPVIGASPVPVPGSEKLLLPGSPSGHLNGGHSWSIAGLHGMLAAYWSRQGDAAWDVSAVYFLRKKNLMSHVLASEDFHSMLESTLGSKEYLRECFVGGRVFVDHLLEEFNTVRKRLDSFEYLNDALAIRVKDTHHVLKSNRDHLVENPQDLDNLLSFVL